MNRPADLAEQPTPPHRDHPEAVKPAAQRLAHLVSVSGSQAVAVLDRTATGAMQNGGHRIEIGQLLKIATPRSSVMSIVSAISSPIPEASGKEELGLIELTLAGEIGPDEKTGELCFRRGVATLPTIGDPVLAADPSDLSRVYIQPNADTIEIGTLYQDTSVPARLLVNELLGKHFMVVGTTGCGKSSALTVILLRILEGYPNAHVVVLDIHNEYQTAFGAKAELITTDNLNLPFWLLNFNELAAALTSTDHHHDAECEILTDAVISAKRRFTDTRSNRLRKPLETTITVDTPTPFRLADIIAWIDEQFGRLDRTHLATPYRRLKSRLETLSSDSRYGFMFGSITVEDNMAEVLGRLFRVSNDGRPITVVDLAAVPSEILDVVISLISRLAFDLALWSQGRIPMLLVCEEAHRYAPSGATEKFLPTRQALARIAREGRKYGIALALVTQRPSEIDSAILSQCSTAIAMRLSTERDQQVMRANCHDSALELLDFLSLLSDREAIILGQGVPMPMRIRFHDLAAEGVPHSPHGGFSHSWKDPNVDIQALWEIVNRWRSGGRTR